jgi:DNA-binding transcriptional regulator GbsR (MarR family)
VTETEGRERHFAEELGLLFEEHGGQRMMGRILGRLLFCQPSHQSSAEIASYLMVSRGSVSTSTRYLVNSGFIERVSFPGDRSTYFRIKKGAWTKSFEAQTLQIRLMRELAQRALDMTDRETGDSVHSRVQEFYDFFRFWEDQMPKLLALWHQERQTP